MTVAALETRRQPPALLSAPFRPFFLLAGLFAAAVFAGFLMTAAEHWTGRKVLDGAPLGLLALAWAAARVLLILPVEGIEAWAIALDAAFLPAVALFLGVAIIATRNCRNLVFPAGILMLAGLNVAVHLAALGMIEADPSRLLRFALELMAVMMVILGGRVVPTFTRNAMPEAGVATWKQVDLAAVFATAAIIPAGVLAGEVVAGVALVAAGANFVRMVPWRGTAVREPLLWVLHVGYLWLAVAFALRAMAELGLVPESAAVHALASGAVAVMTIGMMSRVALGHTGRKLKAAPLTAIAYLLVIGAGVLRLCAIFHDEALIQTAGGMWILGWLFFLGVYAPICLRPRVDADAKAPVPAAAPAAAKPAGKCCSGACGVEQPS